MAHSYYKLERVDVPDVKPGEFRLVTAAVMPCQTCGRPIDGMGGPGEYVCIPCGDVIKSGQARGAIKWSEETSNG